MEENLSQIITDFGDINVESQRKRDVCEKCTRPITVCWCPYLPQQTINCRTTVHILQHPYEERRRLKTAPMLQHSMDPGKCQIYPGKRFPLDKYTQLKRIMDDENTLLLFPSDDSVELTEYLGSLPNPYERQYNIILLDGTWLLAKGIYFKNLYLQKIKQIKLEHSKLSEYVIRTQPTEKSLSTLETAAMTISILENKPEIYETLVKPLRALCDFQMKHGAVVHQSKEYLVQNGLYKKQDLKPTDIPKQCNRRRRRRGHNKKYESTEVNTIVNPSEDQ